MSEKFNTIVDDKMRHGLLDFYNKVELNGSQEKSWHLYISNYKDVKVDTLNWETICDISLSIDSSHLSSNFGQLNLNFIIYLLENNLYKDPFIDKNLDFILNLLMNLSRQKRQKNSRMIIFDKDFNLRNLFICKYIHVKTEYCLLIDTKLDNIFLVELLDGFYKSDLFSNRNSDNDFNFARNFYKSYDQFSSFEKISDFNFKVFEKQFDFYKESKTQLKSLVKFYVYLHSTYEGIFKPNDPVDIFWMTRHPKFIEQFKAGCRLVDLNPIESYPTNDIWMVRPNGQEEFTTVLNATDYILVDFTKVEYSDYRPFLKDFFWNSTLTLHQRRLTFYSIVEFLNFIHKHKSLNIKDNSSYNEITTAEVLSYLGYISNKDTVNTCYKKMDAIKRFLKGDYFDVELSAFEHLAHGREIAPPGSESIPENELKKLDKHLLSIAYDSDRNYIYYTIFRLALNTNFRISQLLSITLDSIKEGMKKEQYYIKCVTKISNKEKTKEHISKYDYRYLEEAIKRTEKIREEAPKEYKDFVFLQYEQSKRLIKGVVPVTNSAFNSFFKRECKNIGLPQYIAENIRDTGITKALDYAVENNLSPQETEILIRGKRSTKLKHYYDNLESKLFVEATYGVIIGNIDLKGQILETTDSSSFSKDETMDDGCGFCKESECRIHKDIGCPMCKFFIVTLDRIPFYIKKLEQLDIAIKNETIEHEKEHLIAIKKLYAAYLSKLLDLKQKLELKSDQNIK